MQRWINDERTRFGWLSARVGQIDVRALPTRFKQHWDTVARAAEAGVNADVETALSEAYGEQGAIVASASALGRFLHRLADQSHPVANATAALVLGIARANSQAAARDPACIAAAVAYAAFQESVIGVDTELAMNRHGAKIVLGRLRKQQEEYTEIIQDARGRVNALTTDGDASFRELREKVESAFQEFLDGARTEFATVQEFFRTELALQAPVQYWSDVAKEARRWARVWGVGFLTLLGTLIALFLRLAEPLRDFLSEVERESVAVILALAVGTALFWALRMTARIFLSNYHRATDAAERETMVKTFLALQREGHVSEKQLDLVLAPLFRPGTSGLVRDDSAPEFGMASLLTRERR